MASRKWEAIILKEMHSDEHASQIQVRSHNDMAALSGTMHEGRMEPATVLPTRETQCADPCGWCSAFAYFGFKEKQTATASATKVCPGYFRSLIFANPWVIRSEGAACSCYCRKQGAIDIVDDVIDLWWHTRVEGRKAYSQDSWNHSVDSVYPLDAFECESMWASVNDATLRAVLDDHDCLL